MFTPGEIECLVCTAAEAVCGNAIADETLSGLQVTLARRAWAVLMPEEPAAPGQAPAPVPGATPPAAETDQHRPSVLGGPCQVCGGECVTITWREDTCYQVTVHAADIAAVYGLFGEEPPADIGCCESDAAMDELLGDYADDDHFISVDSRVITRVRRNRNLPGGGPARAG